jgi:hypothetical protein
MKKEIYLHIGTGKTGTTSLQFWLENNRDKLRDVNVLYPDSLCVDGSFPKGIHRMASEVLEGDMDHLWKSMFDEINKSKCSKVVLSSEYFWGDLFWGNPFSQKNIELFRDSLRSYSVKIIVHLRNPVDIYTSRYRQGIKGGARFNKSFYEFVEKNVPGKNQYAQRLRFWADIFGRESMLILIYEQALENGNMIEHFLKSIGVAIPIDWETQVYRNAALPEETLRALRVWNKIQGVLPKACTECELGRKTSNWLRSAVCKPDNIAKVSFSRLIRSFDSPVWLPEKDIQLLRRKTESWSDELVADGWITNDQARFLRPSPSPQYCKY